MPSILGIVFTYRFSGSKETKDLLKRGIQGFKLIWLIPIFLIPVLAVAAIILTAVITGSSNLITDIATGLPALIMFPFLLLLGGPLFEEFGWRGFALDHLQSKWNGVVASIVLGIIWGVWHLPAFLIVGSSQNTLLEYIPLSAGLFFVQVLLITLMMTVLYNNTDRSILGSLLFHTSWNTTFGGFFIAILTGFVEDPATMLGDTEVINTINMGNILLTTLMLVVCIIMIVKWGVNLGKSMK